MQRWRVHELGEPADVLCLDEFELDPIDADEVELTVEACGLSFPDLLQIRGEYQVKPDLPFGPGSEICGTVTDVGASVDSDLIGTRAVWVGAGGLGSHVHAPADELLRVPDAMDPPAAAALVNNYGTAIYGLHDRGRLDAGETLLVHAGAGGVGSAAIQLGRAAGAMVIATAGGEDKVDRCRELGADVAVDYLTDDWFEIVQAVTDGRGVDVGFDPVGGDVFDLTRRAMAWDGRLLVVGFAGGRIADAPTNHVLMKNYSVVGVHWGAALGRDDQLRRVTHERLLDLFEAGSIDPLVMAPLPLTAVPEAFERLANRTSWGKVIVTP